MRLRESKMSTKEIALNIREWSKNKAKGRLMSAVEIERRADKLAGHLQTAQEWLETATESIRGIQQVLELGAGVGAPVDAMTLEKVLEALSSIQDRLQKTERSVNAVRELALNRVGESEDNRRSRIFRLLGTGGAAVKGPRSDPRLTCATDERRNSVFHLCSNRRALRLRQNEP
jgi:hypothetical protein